MQDAKEGKGDDAAKKYAAASAIDREIQDKKRLLETDPGLKNQGGVSAKVYEAKDRVDLAEGQLESAQKAHQAFVKHREELNAR